MWHNSGHVKHDQHNRCIDNLKRTATGKSLWSAKKQDHEDLPLRNEKDVEDLHEENV